MRAGAIEAGIRAAWKTSHLARLAALLFMVFGAPAALAHVRSHHLSGFRHGYAALHRHGGAVRNARLHHFGYAERGSHTRLARVERYRHGLRTAAARYSYSRLQCVPYAREVSHIGLSGDAFLWWAEAAGRYARGSQPVEGAVLNFRSIRRMPLGHVAVVTAVLDSRTILVTQANWIRGTITNDVTMQDVSAANDWSQVEVELGDSSRWGAAYPTYGFIYDQPASSTVIASAGQGDEVAEAPRPQPIQLDAPDRNLQ